MEKIIGIRIDKTIYKDGNKVVKCFNANYTKAQVLNEALNLARVEETNLLVPRFDSVFFEDGKWKLACDYIEGKSLDAYLKLKSSEFGEYLDKFVELQIKVHNTDCMLLYKLRDKLNYKIEASELLGTKRFELRSKLERLEKQEKLCHGDFTPENIIIDSKGDFYIIDWAHAAIGNIYCDVAISYLELLINYSEDLAKSYLDKYCEKTKIKQEVVLEWLEIVAAARISKAKKEEKKFLMKILNQ